MLVRVGLALINVMLPALAVAGSALPKGFVYLRDIDPRPFSRFHWKREVRFANS